MIIDILSLFPEYFRGPFDVSILKRARERGLVEINLIDIRTFADNKHNRVDDRPYGGGPGMVMMPSPCAKAIRSRKGENSHVVYLTPQGKTLDAKRSQELAVHDHLILLCGHYEGVDQRVIDALVDEEISIGDYVLTNGCLPAIVLVDAVARFIPDVLGNEEAAYNDSFQDGNLEAPQYTRPEEWEGRKVPDVLLGGHHKEIENWREKQSQIKTRRVRQELGANDDSVSTY